MDPRALNIKIPILMEMLKSPNGMNMYLHR